MVKSKQRAKGRKITKSKSTSPRKKGKHGRLPSNKSKVSKVRKLKRLAKRS